MRLIYTDGFQEHERKEVRQVIFSNIVVAFKIIAEEMRDLGLQYENRETEVGFCDRAIWLVMLIVFRNSKQFSSLLKILVLTTHFRLSVSLP